MPTLRLNKGGDIVLGCRIWDMTRWTEEGRAVKQRRINGATRRVMRAALAVSGATLAGVLTTAQVAPAKEPFRVGIASLVNGRSAPQFIAFEERLRQLMSSAGGEPAIDFMLLGGDATRYPVAMQELASRKPDVLVAPGPEISLKAAHEATQTIPIVMIGVDYDPVARGYVHSLAHPGGNITGVYLNTVELAGKRVEMLKETAPGANRLIVFWDAVGKIASSRPKPPRNYSGSSFT